MARSPTTADAFSALAEPRRRELLGAVASHAGECDVSWLVEELAWPQPQVSRHLGVLRRVGLVCVARKGRRRMYSLNGEELRPVYDWIKEYERFWEQRLEHIKRRAEQLERESPPENPPPHSPRL